VGGGSFQGCVKRRKYAPTWKGREGVGIFVKVVGVLWVGTYLVSTAGPLASTASMGAMACDKVRRRERERGVVLWASTLRVLRGRVALHHRNQLAPS